MATSYFPTRRKFERESISYQCGPIAATLSNMAGDRSKFWLQVKNGTNMRWSCRSSIFRTATNAEEIAKYLGMVAGMVNAIDELVVVQEEKEDYLVQVMKNMASISFFNQL
jgi:hypothetical protein